MADANINSVIAVVPVKDHPRAVGWYTRLLGREADIEPADGVAEWQLAENAWLQVGEEPDRAGSSTVIIGVNDLAAQHAECDKAGVPLGEIVEIPEVVRVAETIDPEGNKVVFARDISGAA